jgi:hypothetical protein
MIWPDGQINGLQLPPGTRLIVRDYKSTPGIPITVADPMNLSGGALRMIFDSAHWGSTITTPSTTADLNGTLELGFKHDTNISSLYGTIYHLFNWNGPHVGAFTISSDQDWDTTSCLYTTGEIMLREKIVLGNSENIKPLIQSLDNNLSIPSWQTVELTAKNDTAYASIVTEPGIVSNGGGFFPGGLLSINDGTHTVGDINGGGDIEVINGGELLANSISVDTLTVGAGSIVTINALPDGPTAGGGGLQAVPEPSTLVLLALAGLALVGGCLRRK